VALLVLKDSLSSSIPQTSEEVKLVTFCLTCDDYILNYIFPKHNVSDRVFRILKGEDEQPEVVVHIGTNDIGRERDGDVKNEYREFGWKLKTGQTELSSLVCCRYHVLARLGIGRECS